ncbi:MAG: hypothetical protein EPN21_19760 [Methylococcaceae bacterium]|nr:MAG: hypothetical protein EPN21_19760 [Methylococcaceae bacterium]
MTATVLQLPRDIRQIPRAANDWLVWHPVELFEACRQYGLETGEGMRFSTLHDAPIRRREHQREP